MARRLYAYDLTQAKEFIEELANKRRRERSEQNGNHPTDLTYWFGANPGEAALANAMYKWNSNSSWYRPASPSGSPATCRLRLGRPLDTRGDTQDIGVEQLPSAARMHVLKTNERSGFP